MIISFANKTTEDIYNGINSRHARKISIDLHDKIRRLLDQLDAITQVASIGKPPGNNLEKLKGELSDYWSVRVNKQLRIIFSWSDGHAYNVEIIDYH